MTEGKKICRFCLSSKFTVMNPLISPCNCRGSLEFVHLKCLNRWRRLDVARNGRICSLCLSNYTFDSPYQLELIPETKGIFLYCLKYPGLILMIYNYIYTITLSSARNYSDYYFLEDLYRTSHYVFHFTYAVFFYSEWNVVNRNLYWQQLKSIWFLLLLSLHFYMFTLLDKDIFIVGPFLSFYMGLYWKGHIHILESINTHIGQIENE
jgi:hypothetical protein